MQLHSFLRTSLKDTNLEYMPHGYWRYKGLWHYQWAWEFARRNPAYKSFYPKCRKIYDDIATRVKSLENMDDLELTIDVEFSKTRAYERLKNEFGLIYPENPKKHGKRIRGDIWAPEHFLNVLVINPDEPEFGAVEPKYRINISFDTRRPINFLLEETEEILKHLGCQDHVSHIYPENLQELLYLYGQHTALKKILGRKPTNYEIAQAFYNKEWLDFTREYGSAPDSALNNEFAARYAHKIKKAKDYVEGRQYLDLMRWKPYEGHFNPRLCQPS